MTSELHDSRAANGTFHFKILIPSVVAGAIIGKGGETIAQLQKDVGARVKMSKATDFYPGTSERICLITGNVESIIRTHEFIMEKIKEKPDPNAKMAIDFDHKQPAEREKQVKILVPNSTAGMIIGKGGSYIKQIKEESGAYVQISQKSKDHALAERCITVIGEMDSNKNACHMILSKIVEDPQSGSCLNVSYADVTGPVANFNPTGSPFANPVNVPSGAMNSNTSYSSDGSLNSLSPTNTNSFHGSQSGPSQPGAVPFPGFGIGPTIPPSNVSQIIESVKTMLRLHGYSEQALSDISAAMNTLASYGLLSLGLGILNGLNGASLVGSLGMGMPNSSSTACPMAATRIPSQDIYTTLTGVQRIPAGSNSVATSASMGAGSSLFGPIGSLGNEMPGIGLGPGFTSTSPSRSSDQFLVQTEASTFEPYQRTSPSLASPSAATLPINNNSFGLGTGFNTGPSSLRKSPSPNDRQTGDTSKAEIEVGENIVGAILGPGGKSLVEIQRFSGANIQISKKGIFAPGTRNRIVTITGQPNAVCTAQYLIERQINEEEVKRAQQNAMGVLR